MRTLISLPLLFALACGGGSQATDVEEPIATDGERHPVHIHRAFTAGQRLAVVVDAHQIMEVVVEGTEQEVAGLTEELRIHLEGEITIRDVAEDGRAAHATLVINRFIDPEDDAEILPAGTVIVAQRDEDGMDIGIADGEITADQGLLLSLAFPLERPGSRLGDELMGTESPKGINDTWEINREFMAEDMVQDGFAVTETNITGETRLADVRECAGGRCMMIEANVTATEAAVGALDDTAEFEEGTLNAIVRLELPIDESQPVVAEEAVVTGEFVASFQVAGAAVQRHLALSRMRRATYTPVE